MKEDGTWEWSSSFRKVWADPQAMGRRLRGCFQRLAWRSLEAERVITSCWPPTGPVGLAHFLDNWLSRGGGLSGFQAQRRPSGSLASHQQTEGSVAWEGLRRYWADDSLCQEDRKDKPTGGCRVSGAEVENDTDATTQICSRAADADV